MTAARLGAGCTVAEAATLMDGEAEESPPRIGRDAVVRSGTIVYPDVVVGDRLQTGHDAVIRSGTRIGDDCLVGTKAVVDGDADLGDEVRLQTGVYVPPETTIGDRVFLGPQATLTNDPYPLRQDADLDGPTLADDVTIGANATILPGVDVGERAFVAAGAVVAEDVPPDSLAVGTPAETQPLPEQLAGGNVVP